MDQRLFDSQPLSHSNQMWRHHLATSTRVIITPAISPRMFENFTTLRFGTQRANLIVSTALETVVALTRDQQFIMNRLDKPKSEQFMQQHVSKCKLYKKKITHPMHSESIGTTPRQICGHSTQHGSTNSRGS